MNYSEEEKEAIDRLDFFNKTGYATFMIKYGLDRTTANATIERTIKTVLNLIQKQSKIIDKMAEEILKIDTAKSKFEYDHAKVWDTEKGIKEYFKKEVEKE